MGAGQVLRFPGFEGGLRGQPDRFARRGRTMMACLELGRELRLARLDQGSARRPEPDQFGGYADDFPDRPSFQRLGLAFGELDAACFQLRVVVSLTATRAW